MDSRMKEIICNKGETVQIATGQQVKLIIRVNDCIVDSHMHIMNGACTPLPLLWAKNGLLKVLKHRSLIDILSLTLGYLIMKDGGWVQIKDILGIAERVIKDNESTIGPKSSIHESSLYKYSNCFTLMIAMPMDMDYAHILGYEGKMIYEVEDKNINDNKNDEEILYKNRDDKRKEEKKEFKYLKKTQKVFTQLRVRDKNKIELTKVYLREENYYNYIPWIKQYKDTIKAAKEQPIKIIPMYHYEPRRWCKKSDTPVDSKFRFGPWNYPFKDIVTTKKSGIFLGFKMYTPLGYQPLDPKLTHLWQGDCFYKKCMEENIPILAHCSPGGMTTHDMSFYREFHKNNSGIFGSSFSDFIYERKAKLPNNTYTDKNHEIFSEEYDNEYFFRYHVHPKAWRKVLEKYPNLKLCLAHFGNVEWTIGLESEWIQEIISLINTYPNVYVDFSCHNIEKNGANFKKYIEDKKNEKVLQKILFGTDWYMTLVAVKKSYKEFCQGYWDLITDKDLWLRFVFINPFKFYGFNKKAIINNLFFYFQGKKLSPEASKNLKSNNNSLNEAYTRYYNLKKKKGW